MVFLSFRPRRPVSGPFLSHLSGFHGLLKVSFHLSLGLPLGRIPSIIILATLIVSISSPLLICPDHSNLLPPMTIATGSTSASFNISSFLRCSGGLTRIAHRHLSLCQIAFHLSATLSDQPIALSCGMWWPTLLRNQTVRARGAWYI